MTLSPKTNLVVASELWNSIPLNPMRFVFRADASIEIGAGHVMRSSAIAEEAISQGIECVFVGSILDMDWLTDRIRGLGFFEVDIYFW